jgi:hypothetical protein
MAAGHYAGTKMGLAWHKTVEGPTKACKLG